MRYVATASVQFEYDTDDQPWITTADDVLEDLSELLASGDISVNQYDITIEEEG